MAMRQLPGKWQLSIEIDGMIKPVLYSNELVQVFISPPMNHIEPHNKSKSRDSNLYVDVTFKSIRSLTGITIH